MLAHRWPFFAVVLAGTLMLCVLGPIRLMDGAGIPVTLQSLGVVLIPMLAGSRAGLASVVMYLVLGGLGLPVFAFGTSGWERFAGATGGFLFAFPLAAGLVGLAAESLLPIRPGLPYRMTRCLAVSILLAAAGQILAAALGVVWFESISGPSDEGFAGWLYLLPGLAVKSVAAGLVVLLVDRAVPRPHHLTLVFLCVGSSSALLAQLPHTSSPPSVMPFNRVSDHHSFARPNEAIATHLHWDARVRFDEQILEATATWTVEAAEDAHEVIFDVRDLAVNSVRVDGNAVAFSLGEAAPFIGQPLRVPVTSGAHEVEIAYATKPGAAALLWVEGASPFLFTQSQAILARTWVPCQDSPGIRFSYTAQVAVPVGLMALMSAENPTALAADGVYAFRMDSPIPAYLLALAVGNVAFQPIGPRTGVYAVEGTLAKAAAEFRDLEALVTAAEALYGPYAWGRYDVLMLPAAFPFGGMENPRLTFCTPTILAGDRSLVSLVAHELAHSWSGNLVTNATWDDFWLNEGFTVYFEYRIMEAVYGRDFSEMLVALSRQALGEEVRSMLVDRPADTHLKLHLQGRDPDDGMNAIAYDKGYFLLRRIEDVVGREAFDAFLRAYFEEHAFASMDTESFIEYLHAHLLNSPALASAADVKTWIYGPGLPAACPEVTSARIVAVDSTVQAFASGRIPAGELPWPTWGYQERYRFLTNLPESLSRDAVEALDRAWNITETGNYEVLFAWLKCAIQHTYEPAYARLDAFLIEVGRRKFIVPLYEALLRTGQTKHARAVYAQARSGYHSVATGTLDALLNSPAVSGSR